MYADFKAALEHPAIWFYSAWINFLIRYRKTALGPLWIVAGPAMFVLVLGELFRSVTAHNNALFVPHLAAGLVIWTYITNILNTAPRLYVVNRPALLHGHANHFNIILKVISNALIVLLHQSVIIVVVMMIHRIAPTAQLLLLIPALALLVAHSIWILIVFGLVGARYRDLTEVIEMAIRIAFLATPIIWMAGDGGERSRVVEIFLTFNPLYHVLEPLRGAILGTPIDPLSWIASTVIAVAGLALASVMYRRFRHLAVLWT